MKVHLVTLGCARNEVDSEELAGRLADGGFKLVDEPQDADAIMVNTCGFIDAAKTESINTLLAAADISSKDKRPAVVAVGCLAERYGAQLASEIPEADAVLSFDDYPDIADRLRFIIGGGRPLAKTPNDRRRLLPLTPVSRPDAQAVAPPGHSGPRLRLETGPTAPVKIASGCDRRCTFCAIPAFRGAFLSRPIVEVVADAEWLTERGVREVLLVSENSSSYGKDWADPQALEKLLLALGEISALERIRISYLQPAEIRPSLLAAMAVHPKVVPYYDLSFQHGAQSVLKRMRRYGGAESFLALIDQIRTRQPYAGIRSNVIVGFPGETEDEFAQLLDFIESARLDALGVFGYSDEEGTEAVALPNKVSDDVIAERVRIANDSANFAMEERAAQRIGERVTVLVEEIFDGVASGRAEHQGPEDGGCILRYPVEVGAIVEGVVVTAGGVDLEVDNGET